jgi:hypothetical protein
VLPRGLLSRARLIPRQQHQIRHERRRVCAAGVAATDNTVSEQSNRRDSDAAISAGQAGLGRPAGAPQDLLVEELERTASKSRSGSSASFISIGAIRVGVAAPRTRSTPYSLSPASAGLFFARNLIPATSAYPIVMPPNRPHSQSIAGSTLRAPAAERHACPLRREVTRTPA